MSYNEYRKLLENVGTRAFLAKPYGLELLFILERCELENADNGVEDTYELLTQFKPRRGAFSTFYSGSLYWWLYHQEHIWVESK